MVEHPVSMEFDENSSDIELTLDVTEEPIHAASNGVTYKKKGQEFESLSTIDENTIDNDLSINSRIIETIMEEEELDSVEVEATSCDPVSRSCSKITSPEKSNNGTDNKTDSCGIENHVSDSSANINGFSSKGSSDDDIPQDEFDCKKSNKSNSPLRKLLGNGSLKNMWQSNSEKMDRLTEGEKSVSEETRKPSTDLPFVESCDKSIHHSSNECRVNGDIPKLRDDGSVSPAVFKRKLDADSGDSDSGSGSSSSYPEKRSKFYNSGNSSSCPVKSPKIDDSVVPNGYSDSENSINSVASNSFQQKKKTTARKSTGGNAMKIIARLTGEDCAKEKLAVAEDLVVSMENGVDNSTTDFVDVNTPSDGGRQSPVNGGHQSPVDEECQSPVDEGRQSPMNEGRLSPVDEARQSPVDEARQSPVDERKYPIKLTRESMSNESLKTVFKKMVKLLSRRQLEEIVLQKCCDVISESSEIGEIKKRKAEREETETFRKNKIFILEKQLYQLKAAADVFCTKARQVKENGQIASPKIITRSVGLQVDLHTSTEPNSPTTRASSIDEGDQTAPPAVMNSQISSTDTGQSSNCSSPTKSPRPSFSEIVNTGKSQKPSLPTDNNSAVNGKSNTILPIEKNPPSETPAKAPPAPSEDVIVDLTDLDDNADSPPRPSSIAPKNGLSTSRLRQPSELPVSPRHPAPLPPTPKGRNIPGAKLPPPKPNLSIQKNNLAIQMTWDLILNADHEPIEKYQIYAYQETAGIPVSVVLWKLVGDVESLDLPMACTLTQFVNGYTYHFAVRAVDKHGRHGPFSCAKSIAL